MRKMMLAMMLGVMLLAGCASLPPYFTNPANTQVFGQLGMNCVIQQPQEYGAGVMYEYLKSPTGYQMSQSHVIKVVVQCGQEFYSVVCDPSLKPDQNPCTNLQVWRPTTPPMSVKPACK